MIDLISLSSFIIINRCIVELYYIWFYTDNVCQYFVTEPLRHLCEMVQDFVDYKYYYTTNTKQDAISFLILACTAIFTLMRSHELGMPVSPPTISYYLVIAHAMLGGIHYYVLPTANVEDALNFTGVMMTLFLFPCFVAEMWYKYGYVKEFAYIHILLSLLPAMRVVQKSYDSSIVDTILTLNIASAVCISLDKGNWYGIAASVAYITHLLLARNHYSSLPATDAKNYALGVFLVLSMRALSKCCYNCRHRIK